MHYRVELVRVLRQYGEIEIDAESVEDATRVAGQLTALPGVIVKQPTWGVQIETEKAQVIRVTEAA